MSIAEDYFVIAHDDHTGLPQLDQSKLGYGLAAAMLADLALAGHVAIGEGRIVTDGHSVPPDPLEHQTLDLIRREPTHSVRMWLDYLAQDARSQVGERLVRVGAVRREAARRLLRRIAVYPPLDIDRGARRAARLVSGLRDPRTMTPQDVTLVKILAVTELIDHALWWEPKIRRAALPTVEAMVPPPLRELAYHTQTAIGTAALEQ